MRALAVIAALVCWPPIVDTDWHKPDIHCSRIVGQRSYPLKDTLILFFADDEKENLD